MVERPVEADRRILAQQVDALTAGPPRWPGVPDSRRARTARTEARVRRRVYGGPCTEARVRRRAETDPKRCRRRALWVAARGRSLWITVISSVFARPSVQKPN